LKSHEWCPLCGESRRKLVCARARKLYECGGCRLVYAERSELLSREEQRERYLLHENGIDNQGYCEFLHRVIEASRPYITRGAKGLDYGCGPVPTLSALASREGIEMSDYDPIFLDNTLAPPYGVVFSTECFEHFEEPGPEIEKVMALLGAGGILAIMTELWNESTDFDRWYYASDPTHVSFYSEDTIEYIARRYRLERLAGDGKRVFVFRKVRV